MQGESLKRKILASGHNVTETAKLIGMSQQSLSQSLSAQDVKTGLIEKISAAFKIPISYFYDEIGKTGDWLLSGKGSMLADDHPAVSYDPAVGKPYYDVDFEGGFVELFNSQTAVPANNIVIKGFEKADLWCNVTGHSMEPKINHGDIIALHHCTIDDVQYGEIYAVVLDTLRTIKILRRAQDPASFLFVPINREFDAQEYSKARILHVFEVIGAISKFF